jgi:hypothetical protein
VIAAVASALEAGASSIASGPSRAALKTETRERTGMIAPIVGMSVVVGTSMIILAPSRRGMGRRLRRGEGGGGGIIEVDDWE